VVLTPTITGIKSYQLAINPPQLSTKGCSSNCEMTFSFHPTIPCAFNNQNNEFKITVEIKWSVQYSIKTSNAYFPAPKSMRIAIIEEDLSNDGILLFCVILLLAKNVMYKNKKNRFITIKKR